MRLLRPSIEYKQQVLEYKNEFIENGDDLAVTCNTDNIASSKTIKSCGGIFENEVCDDGALIHRY